MSELPLREARIDLAAIRDNAMTLVAQAGTRPVLADVSADGYGHGALGSALAAIEGGASWIGVSDLPAALELRSGGIQVPIAVAFLAGPDDEALAAEYGVLPWDATGVVAAVVDVGAALYGVGVGAESLGLRAAMRVSTRVIGTKTIEAGDGVSYGYTFRAEARTNLALVVLGYADGLDRRASNLGRLLLGGKLRLIAGRVAMNVAVLELGDDEVNESDEAVIFGDTRRGEPSADSWAASLAITSAEAVTTFGRTLPRSFR